MKRPEVSIIVTAHNEGIIAHKTMLSVLESANLLEKQSIPYEVLVHIDNGTPLTKKYFQRYENHPRVRLFENEFGDLSASRNFTVQQVRGNYIAITDADDLYSKDWLVKFYQTIKGKKNIVARFSHVVTFGGWNTIVTDNQAMTPDDEFLYLFDSTTYGSPCMFHKSIYKKFPQRHNERPYGFEDWQWILDTKAAGITHQVVPKTALFYRKSPFAKPSLLGGQVMYRATLSQSPFFEFARLKKKSGNYHRPIATPIQKGSPVKQVKQYLKYRLYHTLVYCNSFKVYRTTRNLLRPTRKDTQVPRYVVPQWLLDDWKRINKIEKTTFPDEYILKDLDVFIPNKEVGYAYLSIVDKLTQRPDTLYFVPWLKAGGADKVFITMANELALRHHDWHVVMMQTYRGTSEWANKLNDAIDFINLEKELQHMDYEKQMQFMALFLVQNAVKRIVIANSKFAYDFVMRYKELIRSLDVKIYVFAFASAISKEGRIGGFVHEELPFIQDVVYKYITDNTAVISEICEQNALDCDNFCVCHQFVECPIVRPQKRKKKLLRILWASRVSPEKLPEVLVEIRKKLSDDFVIDVYGKLEYKYTDELFNEVNIHYKRPFNGINDLPTDKYDIFLYTSRSDGMPNILLEIAAKGLPIIAPRVGGIGDLIKNDETGILIEDSYDIDAYVVALERLRNEELRYKLATGAQAMLKRQFNEKKWKEDVCSVFDK